MSTLQDRIDAPDTTGLTRAEWRELALRNGDSFQRAADERDRLEHLRAAAQHVRELPEGHLTDFTEREHLGHHVMTAILLREIERLRAAVRQNARRNGGDAA